MPKSMLIVYESINKFGRMTEYWKNYITFYEEYWGGPTSPYGVWFGNEYIEFRDKLSKFLNIERDELQDCLFMRGNDGNYLISPLRSYKNPYILNSDNYIPLHWFILFDDKERKFFYTHLGFGRIHYGTDLKECLRRIDEADGIIDDSTATHDESDNPPAMVMKLKKIQSEIFILKTWLSEFDMSSYVVLDYGEICSFISPYALNMDHSSKDIWEMLNNLKMENMGESQRILNSLLQRWESAKQKILTDVLKNDVQ